MKSKQFHPETLKLQLNALAQTSQNMREVLNGILDAEDPLYKIVSARLAAYEGAPIDKLSAFYAKTLYHMLLGGLVSAHPGTGKEENYVNLSKY